MEKPRILLAISPDDLFLVKDSLNKTFDMQLTHSYFEAKRRLSVAKYNHDINLFIISVPFNHSESLELLQVIRAQEVFDAVPIVVLQFHDVDESAEDVKARADKLGASSYLDLRGLQQEDIEKFLPAEIEACLAEPNVFERAAQEVVMIADVDPFVRNLARRFITEAGYKATVVSDGYDALDMARKDPPRLLLADMLLPRLDGLALCRLIKEDPSTKHIITVIVFSVINAEDKARNAGADAFLKKPIEKSRMLELLKETLGAMSKETDGHDGE